MTHLPPGLYERLRRQHGVISVDQLRGHHVDRRHVDRLVANGTLVGGLRGTYRSPAVVVDELSRCAEVCLARPLAAIAGPTAGRIDGFPACTNDRRIHAIAPPASNPAIAPWVVPYRTAAIDPATEIVQRDDGIRITAPARTAYDLTRHLRDDQLLAVIEHVIAKHRVSDDDLATLAAQWVTRGRPWIARFFRQLERRLPGGAAESEPEIRVGLGLRARGVRHLVRQHRIELPIYGRARFDLAVPCLRWAIEVDKHPGHITTAGVARDERRDDAAESIDWTISRVSAGDDDHRLAARLDELATVHRHLQHTMSQRTTHNGTPSPQPATPTTR